MGSDGGWSIPINGASAWVSMLSNGHGESGAITPNVLNNVPIRWRWTASRKGANTS
jgi:hypothetical protein